MIKRTLYLGLAIVVLAGCSQQSDKSDDGQPFGPEWKAKQASHVKACTAKGYSAAACEQTNPADEYTDEFRRSMLKHGEAIEQCLKDMVGPCRQIENENVGDCMFYASEVIKPADSEYRAEKRDLCALTLRIIREAGQP